MPYMLTNGFIVYGSSVIFCDAISESHNPVISTLQHSGFTTNTGINAIGFKPVMKFSSRDVAGVMAAIGLGANPVTGHSVVAYKQNLANEGIRGSGTHSKTTISNGLLVIDSFGVNKESAATVSGTIYPYSSDGITDPMAIVEGSVSLPSVTPFSNSLHLGSVSLNGTSLSSIRGWNLSISNSVISEITNGAYYPTFADLESQEFKFSVNTLDPASINTLIGQKALAGASGGLALTLNSTASGVITNTAAMTFSAALGLGTVGEKDYQQGSILSTSFTFDVISNGSASPVIIS